jgi:hypothetical protein
MALGSCSPPLSPAGGCVHYRRDASELGYLAVAAGGSFLLVVAAENGVSQRSPSRLINASAFRHSLRSLLLKASMKALPGGFPGHKKSRVTSLEWGRSKTGQGSKSCWMKTQWQVTAIALNFEQLRWNTLHPAEPGKISWLQSVSRSGVPSIATPRQGDAPLRRARSAL